LPYRKLRLNIRLLGLRHCSAFADQWVTLAIASNPILSCYIRIMDDKLTESQADKERAHTLTHTHVNLPDAHDQRALLLSPLVPRPSAFDEVDDGQHHGHLNQHTHDGGQRGAGL
jgi:hypothetical protein